MIKIIGLALLLTIGLSTPVAAQSPSASVPTDTVLLNRPDAKVGDSFTYRRIDGWTNKVTEVFTHEVVEVTNDMIRMRASREGSSGPSVILTFTRDWNLMATSSLVFKPFFPHYQFPIMKVGQRWTGKAEEDNKVNGNNVQYTTESTVEGIEKVTVPAGTFEAVKIKIKMNYRARTMEGSGSGTITETRWLVPEAGRFVRYAYEDTSWSGQPYRKYYFELEKVERK